MYCIKCGKEIESYSKPCDNCGELTAIEYVARQGKNILFLTGIFMIVIGFIGFIGAIAAISAINNFDMEQLLFNPITYLSLVPRNIIYGMMTYDSIHILMISSIIFAVFGLIGVLFKDKQNLRILAVACLIYLVLSTFYKISISLIGFMPLLIIQIAAYTLFIISAYKNSKAV